MDDTNKNKTGSKKPEILLVGGGRKPDLLITCPSLWPLAPYFVYIKYWRADFV